MPLFFNTFELFIKIKNEIKKVFYQHQGIFISNFFVNIISYTNRRYSNGNVYYKNGFENIRVNSPSYYYIDENYNKRYNRNNITLMLFLCSSLSVNMCGIVYKMLHKKGEVLPSPDYKFYIILTLSCQRVHDDSNDSH